jgi:hypothetical protein
MTMSDSAFSPEIRASLGGMRAAALTGDSDALSVAAERLSELLGQDGADALACGIVAAGIDVLLAEDPASLVGWGTIRRGPGADVPDRPIITGP